MVPGKPPGGQIPRYRLRFGLVTVARRCLCWLHITDYITRARRQIPSLFAELNCSQYHTFSFFDILPWTQKPWTLYKRWTYESRGNLWTSPYILGIRLYILLCLFLSLLARQGKVIKNNDCPDVSTDYEQLMENQPFLPAADPCNQVAAAQQRSVNHVKARVGSRAGPGTRVRGPGSGGAVWGQI